MKAYELTNYPRIYTHTYWGAFGADTRPAKTEFIQNRNRFIHEYNIKKSAHRPKYIQKILDECEAAGVHLDHVECYANDNNEYVIVSSPYDTTEPNRQKYAEKGWTHIYKLYVDEADTFIKIIPMKRKRPSFDESSWKAGRKKLNMSCRPSLRTSTKKTKRKMPNYPKDVDKKYIVPTPGLGGGYEIDGRAKYGAERPQKPKGK